MPTLERITVYPIKSLDGVVLESCRVLAGGALEHDRRYALVDAEGVFAYAGIAAEDLLAGRDEPADGGPGGESARTRVPATGDDDRERLAKLASTLGRERPADRFFEAYWEEARRLLRQNWSSVERVAAALLEHGRLNGDRVDVLVL